MLLYFQILRLCLVVCLLVFTFGLCAQPSINQYVNPLDVSIADPAVLKDGNTYYLYGTTYDPEGFSVYSSTDLVHWRRHGLCWQKTSTSWGQRDFWAPEVIKVGSLYYMYYTTWNTTVNLRNICIASSPSPLGPFNDIVTPLLPENIQCLDGHPFKDPVSGKYYFYFTRESNGHIYVAEMSNPPTSLVTSRMEILKDSQSWENGWVEAPHLHYRSGTYYLMYSGNQYFNNAYAVGCATSSSPTGPFTKRSDSRILKQNAAVSGPGHNGIAFSPDGSELFIVYHTHLSFDGGGPRQLAIDRLQFLPDGSNPDILSVQNGGPTSTQQLYPSGAAPRSYGQSDEFALSVLNRNYWHTFGEESNRWQIESGRLRITTQNGDIHTDNVGGKNIFLQYLPDGDLDVETRVDFTPGANHEQAFLLIWQDQSNYIRLSTVYVNGIKIELAVETNGVYSSTVINNSLGSNVRFKIERRSDNYTAFIGSGATSSWTQVGSSIQKNYIQPEAGIGAMAPVSGAAINALFEYLRIIPRNTSVDDWQLY